jgi:hypothetical protein
MLRNILGGMAALVLSVNANAIFFNGSYTVTANTDSSTGLAVLVFNSFGNGANPTSTFTSLSVLPGASQFLSPLFEMDAAESSPYMVDDLIPKAISVMFNFTSPSVVSGTITGTTVGQLNNLLDDTDDTGFVHWNGPLSLVVGDHQALRITLTDAEFGDFPGFVAAQLDLFVPEPGVLALLGIGLLGIALGRKRTTA